MTITLETADPETLAAWMRDRRSIRLYRDTPLSRAAVERLIEAACHAPSAHNRQPWRFAILEAADDKARLAADMAARLRADRLADGDEPDRIERDAANSQARISGAPAVVVVCVTTADMDRYPDAQRAEAERIMAIQSTAMAVQNLLLLAQAEGLGACWMCAPLFCPDTVRASLNLPSDWQPQALVTLGHPAASGRKRERKALSEVVR